jgi:hypothetical protein
VPVRLFQFELGHEDIERCWPVWDIVFAFENVVSNPRPFNIDIHQSMSHFCHYCATAGIAVWAANAGYIHLSAKGGKTASTSAIPLGRFRFNAVDVEAGDFQTRNG